MLILKDKRMVLNLSTGEDRLYPLSLSAQEAVVEAWKESLNEEVNVIPPVEISRSGLTCCCGDWATLILPNDKS